MNGYLRATTATFLLLIASAAAQIHAQTADIEKTRADFLKLIDRPKVDPELEIDAASAPDARGLIEIPFSLAVERGRRMPGIIVKPAQGAGKRPVLIALHGTGGNMHSEIGIVRAAAARGFVGVVVDAPYHGARADERGGQASYEDAILRAWTAGQNPAGGAGARRREEHPLYYDTVWNVMRLVDWLATRDDVDAARIGLYGVSKGGIEAYLTAAVDSRIAVVAPAIGLESFHWALENDKWQPRVGTFPSAFNRAARQAGVEPSKEFARTFYGKVMPGIEGEFDGPAMVKLIAPRPFMTINGDSDDRTPLGGLQECIDAAKQAYAAAPEKFSADIQKSTGHQVRREAQQAAVEWFVKWLKPEPIG